MKQQLQKVSKYLSYILRHKPEEIGLELDEKGWASIHELIEKSVAWELTEELIKQVVVTSGKKRFRLSEDGKRIKANQGRSTKAELDLEPTVPPAVLYHGTVKRFMEKILKDGLRCQQKQYVHLSDTVEVAKTMDSRYGLPVILHLNAGQMAEDGIVFFKTTNNVWLVERVAVKYIQKVEEL